MSSAPPPPAWVFEPFPRMHDFFFISRGATQLFGRQRPLSPWMEKPRMTSLVDASMLLGYREREQLCGEGMAVFYRPVEGEERERLFHEIALDPLSDLYFPFPAFSRAEGVERRTDPAYWTALPERVQELDDGERPLREIAVDLLADYDLKGKVLYDPACSTGAFLKAIQTRYPEAHTIGQDASPALAEHAGRVLDEVHCGDAISPAIAEESADFLFLRFLNFYVVSTMEAHRLFAALASRCKVGGYMLVIGHSPVLISSPWLELAGFRVLRRIAHWKECDAIVQFYWLQRCGARVIPRLRFS